jgi:hypothetical protein
MPMMVTNLGAIPRYAPYRPAARPLPYAPAPVRPRPILASATPRRQLGAFSMEEVPSSIVIAGVGAGAFYFSGILPTPWDIVVKGVSAMAIGYALYKVFSAPPPEGAALPTGAQVGPATPIARQEDFDLITASFTTPKMYSTVSSSFWTNKYGVDLLVSYGLADTKLARDEQKPVTMIVQLEASETPYYLTGNAGDKTSGVVGSQQITLNPGDQRTLHFDPEIMSSTNFRPVYQVTLSAYKIRVGGVGKDKMTFVNFTLK